MSEQDNSGDDTDLTHQKGKYIISGTFEPIKPRRSIDNTGKVTDAFELKDTSVDKKKCEEKEPEEKEITEDAPEYSVEPKSIEIEHGTGTDGKMLSHSSLAFNKLQIFVL